MKRALAVTVVVCVYAVGVTPVVQAADEEAVHKLRKQISELQAQIAEMKQHNTAELGSIQVTRALAPGGRGPEVRMLQQFLNSRRGIQVAASGPGSPGRETQYFGSKTRTAVTAFQRRHAADVLAPVGLTQATGYVGPQTRQKINALAAAGGGGTDTDSVGQQDADDFPGNPTENDLRERDDGEAADDPNAPVIDSISPAEGADGADVTIRGERFDREQNTVEVSLMRPVNYPSVASPDGETLTVTVETYIAQAIRARLPSYDGSMELSEINARYSEKFPTHFDVKIRVKNSDGVSHPATFELTSI